MYCSLPSLLYYKFTGPYYVEVFTRGNLHNFRLESGERFHRNYGILCEKGKKHKYIIQVYPH